MKEDVTKVRLYGLPGFKSFIGNYDIGIINISRPIMSIKIPDGYWTMMVPANITIYTVIYNKPKDEISFSNNQNLQFINISKEDLDCVNLYENVGFKDIVINHKIIGNFNFTKKISSIKVGLKYILSYNNGSKIVRLNYGQYDNITDIKINTPYNISYVTPNIIYKNLL
jgi:hypothetical protein